MRLHTTPRPAATVLLPVALVAALIAVGNRASAEPQGQPAGDEGVVTAAPVEHVAPTGPTGAGEAVARVAPVTARAVAAETDAGSEVAMATSQALRALAPHVRRASNSGALRTAFHAYFSYRSAHPSQVRKPYLYFVDLGLDNQTPRGYVFDMEQLTVVEGPFTVAHGRGSSRARNGVPTTFSNRPGSAASSLGLYLAQETYTFSGKISGRRYSSVGLRMRGESGEFNSAARARGVVAHGAPYVSARDAGRSEGCPAMEQHRADRLLPLLANGGVVFIYSPNENRWLSHDPWINA